MRKPGFICILLTWAASSVVLWVNVKPAVVSWSEIGFVLAATTCTFIGLARRLPVQNVLVVALLLTFVSAAMVWLGAISGWPSGASAFTPRMGATFFGAAPWPVALLWIVTALNARGVAELILRPWRQ